MQKKAYKYALLTVLLWSSVASAFKLSLQYLSVANLVFYASLSSFIFLFMLILYQKKLKDFKKYIKISYKKILLLSIINPFLYYLVLFKAYELLSAQEAQAINYTWALSLSFLSIIFLKQKMFLNDIVAGLISYLAVLIIATKGNLLSLEFSNIQGVSLALISTFLWASYWIINTKNTQDILLSLAANFLFSLPFIFIYLLFTKDFQVPNTYGLLGSIYVGLFEMGLTFLLWQKALKYASNTSKIANLIFISPFLSLVFIYFLLDEKIHISTIFGLVLIIVALSIQRLNKSTN